jgi:hypothetical protein
MKILIDAFGCDNPEQFISGIAPAINETQDVTLVVAGNRDIIESVLADAQFDRTRLEILDTSEVISNEDAPVMAIRRKKKSSLVVAYDMLKKNDEHHVLITAGNTGAVIAGAVLILGREDVETRPTLVTFLPNEKGTMTCLADCGANVDCRAEHLLLRFLRIVNGDKPVNNEKTGKAMSNIRLTSSHPIRVTPPFPMLFRQCASTDPQLIYCVPVFKIPPCREYFRKILLNFLTS